MWGVDAMCYKLTCPRRQPIVCWKKSIRHSEFSLNSLIWSFVFLGNVGVTKKSELRGTSKNENGAMTLRLPKQFFQKSSHYLSHLLLLVLTLLISFSSSFSSSFRFPLSLTNTGSLLPAVSSCRSRHLATPSQLLACFWNSWLILSLTSFKTSLSSQSQIFCVLFSSMAPSSSLSFMSSCHSHRQRPVPTEGSGANSPRKMETRSHVRPQTTTPSYQDGPSSGHELWKHELTQSITSSSLEIFFFEVSLKLLCSHGIEIFQLRSHSLEGWWIMKANRWLLAAVVCFRTAR